MEIILGVNRKGTVRSAKTNNQLKYPAITPYFLSPYYEGYNLNFRDTLSQIMSGAVGRYSISNINAIATMIHQIVNCSIPCKVMTDRKNTIRYIIPADRRLGAISVDSNNPSFADVYKKSTKHRFDIDGVLNAKTVEEALHSIYEFTNSFISWVNQRNYYDGIVVYKDSIKDYVALKVDYSYSDEYTKVTNEDVIANKLNQIKQLLLDECTGYTYDALMDKLIYNSTFGNYIYEEVVGNLTLKQKGDNNALQL